MMNMFSEFEYQIENLLELENLSQEDLKDILGSVRFLQKRNIDVKRILSTINGCQMSTEENVRAINREYNIKKAREYKWNKYGRKSTVNYLFSSIKYLLEDYYKYDKSPRQLKRLQTVYKQTEDLSKSSFYKLQKKLKDEKIYEAVMEALSIEMIDYHSMPMIKEEYEKMREEVYKKHKSEGF